MSGRKLRLAAVRLAALALAFTLGVILFSSPYPARPPLDILDQVEAGMSLADVEGLIGSPPGDYRSGPVIPVDPRREQGIYWEDEDEWMTQDLPTYKWQADTIELEFTFTRGGKVATGSYRAVKRQELGPLDTLVWRAKRQWRRWFPEK